MPRRAKRVEVRYMRAFPWSPSDDRTKFIIGGKRKQTVFLRGNSGFVTVARKRGRNQTRRLRIWRP